MRCLRPGRLLHAALLSALIGPVAAQAGPLDVTDLTGQTVALKGPAERVVMIPIPSTSTIIALDGGAGRLVGMHPLAKSAIEEGVLGTFFPEAKDVASDIINNASSQGFAPNVEAIAALRPDLVVQWGDEGDDVVGPLRNAGLTVGLLRYGDEAKARAIITFLGGVIGKDAKAASLIAWRDGTLARIRPKVLGLAQADRPKVLYLLRAKSELRAAGAGTYNDFYINLVGGRNAAAELAGFKPVNAEQVAAWNPDVILINGFESDVDLSAVYGSPVLSQTNAAVEKRVYKMPIGGYRWDPPSQESPLTWMWLADLLHPELFDFDIRGEVIDAYGKIYGHVPTQEQIDAILRMPMNGKSAGYERFVAG